MNHKFNQIIVVVSFLLFSVVHAQDLTDLMTFNGQLVDTSDIAVVATSVVLRVGIRNPSQSCLLFEELHTVSLGAGANGRFSLSLGGGTRTGSDPGLTVRNLLTNDSSVNLAGCYTPVSGDRRALNVTVVSIDAVSVNDTLTAQYIQAVPYAKVADSLQGKSATGFINTDTNITQAKATDIFNQHTNLMALSAGTSTQYVRRPTGSGAEFPSYSGNPSSLSAGQVWYDTTLSQMRYYNGTTALTLGGGGSGTVTSVATGAGLTGGPITTSGTISVDTAALASTFLEVTDASTSSAPNSVILRDASGNFSAGSGTFTGDVTASNFVGGEMRLLDSGSNRINLRAPTTVTSNYNITFPSTQGSAGEVLKLDGSGNLTWAQANSNGTLTAGNIWVGNGSNLATEFAPGGDVSMDSSGQFTVNSISGVDFNTTGSTPGKFLRMGASQYTPVDIGLADIKSSINASQVFPTSCTSAETYFYMAGTDQFGCQSIQIDAGSVTSGTLPVSRGGTGTVSFPANSLLSGNGTGAIAPISLLTDAVLTSDASGIPQWQSQLSVTRGGTGAGTAPTARTNLGAAASGSNSDITQLNSIGTGTAANPSIKIFDTDSGFYSTSAGTVSLSTEGVNRLTVGSTGSFNFASGSILTTSTGNLTFLAAPGFSTLVGNNNGADSTSVVAGGGGLYLSTFSNGNMTLESGFASNGNIDISTTNGTGVININSASGAANFASNSGTTMIGGNAGAAATTIRSGTGGIRIGSTGGVMTSGILMGTSTPNASVSSVLNVTVTGAAIGDFVTCSAQYTGPTVANYWTLNPTVAAANTVSVVALKTSLPGNITTLRCVVIK